MIFGDHHSPLWLRDYPYVPALGKVASNRRRRIASVGTPTAKEGQSSRSRKKEAPSRDSPAQASKKKKTTTTRASRGVIIQKTVVQDPLPVEESTAQGVSPPMIKRPVRKIRAGKRTFAASASSSAPIPIAVLKSTRNIVYFKRRVSVSTTALLLVN